MIYANELTLERSLDNSTMRASHTRKTNPATTGVGLRATGTNQISWEETEGRH